MTAAREQVPIPISAGKRIADEYGYDQVVIVGRRVGGFEHVTTYGRDKANCGVAARMGDFFKHKLMGWPSPESTIRDAATAEQPIKLNIIRRWPEGFEDRLQDVWLDVVSFIPNVKLYDLQRVLAEFGFRMDVYESAGRDASPAEPGETPCA